MNTYNSNDHRNKLASCFGSSVDIYIFIYRYITYIDVPAP